MSIEETKAELEKMIQEHQRYVDNLRSYFLEDVAHFKGVLETRYRQIEALKTAIDSLEQIERMGLTLTRNELA
jgi:hypothetical protein